MDHAPASWRGLQSIGRVAGSPYAARDCARTGVGYGVDRHNIADPDAEARKARADHIMARLAMLASALFVLALICGWLP